MKYILIYIILTVSIISTNCSGLNSQKETKDTEYNSIKKSIQEMFVGMKMADTLHLNTYLDNNCEFKTLYTTEKGNKITITSRKEFYSLLNNLKSQSLNWEERILDYKISRDSNFANVFTPYQFYLNDTIIHCGINNFQMVKQGEVWVIHSVFDTRRTNCK